MIKKFKAFLVMLLLIPSILVISACDGGDGEGDGGLGGGDTTPVTYSLDVKVDESFFNYNRETNTITLEYGSEFYFDQELFNVSLVGSDGSTSKVYWSQSDEDKESGYIITATDGFSLWGVSEAGNYEIKFKYKTYLKKINIVISEVVVNPPVLTTDTFEYGSYIYILSAGDKAIDIVDVNNFRKVASIPLPVSGFPKKITQIEDSHIAIITNVTDNSYVIFNLQNGKIEGVNPINIPINDILILRSRL